MEVRIGSFSEVPRTGELYAMFDGLYEDGVVFEDYERILAQHPIVFVERKGVFCGFFTITPDGEYAEIHAYILPSQRRMSVKVMRYALDLAHKTGLTPMTKVSGDYPHIKRYLEMLGSRVFKVEHNSVMKRGVVYDRFYLSHKIGE